MACSRFPVALTTAILLWIAWTETTSAERGGYGRQPDGRSTSGWCFVVRPRPWQLAGVSGRSCSLRAQETQSLNRWKGRRRGLGWGTSGRGSAGYLGAQTGLGGREGSVENADGVTGRPNILTDATPRASAIWSKPVTNRLGMFRGRYQVVVAGEEDLDDAGELCIKVFFGVGDSPWKAAQLRQLMKEQRQDLKTRFDSEESVRFKAIDTHRGGEMVGFVEISAMPGTKYGMGSGIMPSDVRPVVSNLAVKERARCCGIGSALMAACHDMVVTWGYREMVLQVEEDNVGAIRFYTRLGFHKLFVDRAARRYDTSGFLLQNVRTSKITMVKMLYSEIPTKARRPADSVIEHLTSLLSHLGRAFLTRPPSVAAKKVLTASPLTPGTGTAATVEPVGEEWQGMGILRRPPQ